MAKPGTRASVRGACSALVLLVAAGVACSGKDTSNASNASVPALSNLLLSPQSAAVNDGSGSVTVWFAVDVSDAGADVSSIVITVLDGKGAQVNQFSGQLQNPPGLTSGTITGHFPIATTIADSYTVQVQVFDAGGRGSNVLSAPFPVVQGNPIPTLSVLSPTSAPAGGPTFTLTVTGSGFVASSYVQWNGMYLPTTFVDGSTLQASVAAYLVSNPGTAQITVFNPPPGGGTSSALTFNVTTPAQPGVTIVNIQANDLVWDPYQRKIYLSVPSLAAVNPNTITILDPFTGQLTSSQFAGSEPGVLAISDDGQFLYTGLRGAGSVNRFALPDLTQNLSIPLGRDPYFGQYHAGDLQVAPASPHAIAVSLAVGGVSPSAQGGVVIFDDATPRPTRVPGFGGTGHLFDSLQWGSDASKLYAANNEDTGFDFYTLSVNASGVVLTNDFPSTFSSFWNRIHFDAGTGLVYGDDGHAVDPATGLWVGTFSTSGLWWPIMVPDSSLGSAFFLGQESSWLVLQPYDLAHFVPGSSLTISYVAGPATRLIRWGPDGLAFLAGSAVVLVRGSTVLPVSSTPNPAPAVASLSPSGAAAGSGNIRLAVTGSGFVPGSVVRWNGSDRSTKEVSPTQLVAFIPASDVAVSGTAQITVSNPLPGGGVSGSAAFDVTP